jgi:signal transduction histidine kinase
MSYGVFLLASPDTLASLGEVAFGAMAQLTPALVLAFTWRKASLTGVFSGIFIGFILWLFIGLFPQFGFNIFNNLAIETSQLTLLSLVINTTVIVILSLLSRQSVQERMQLALFLEKPLLAPTQHAQIKKINAAELQLLVARFVGDKVAKKSFAQFYQQHDKQKLNITEFKQALLNHTEKTLAKVMGASSARLVLSSALEGRDLALDELATLMAEATTQQQQFSQNLLQHAIENASEGISIIDADLKLVAWNKKYIELFNYPKALVYVGCPIEHLIRYNAERGLCGPGDINQQVSKRLAYLQQGSPHQSERIQPDGKVIRIEGNPLPNGGFVMLFTDITVYYQAEKLLKQANQTLESRVIERTHALEQANKALAQLHQQAEQAHQNKSLYLNACSHDLVQPLEAAKLFANALACDTSLSPQQLEKVEHINQSLLIANDMLASLGELARIENDQISANIQPVSIAQLFESLAQEFTALAKQQQVVLRFVSSKHWIMSDNHLLHRILQNLISNAIRYASPGKIIVGLKRHQGKLALCVIDNGPGIPLDKQQTVFEQFTRLNNHNNTQAKGLGLGLSISQSFAKLLNHHLNLRSIEGKGSCFNLLATACKKPKQPHDSLQTQDVLTGVTVLCVDNEPDILAGMHALLTTWQCQVLTANTAEQAKQLCHEYGEEIDILLMDFQLDNNTNGIELTQELREILNKNMPAILITANSEQHVHHLAQKHDMALLKKMIKPAQLRALMSAKLTAVLQKNYLS